MEEIERLIDEFENAVDGFASCHICTEAFDNALKWKNDTRERLIAAIKERIREDD